MTPREDGSLPLMSPTTALNLHFEQWISRAAGRSTCHTAARRRLVSGRGRKEPRKCGSTTNSAGKGPRSVEGHVRPGHVYELSLAREKLPAGLYTCSLLIEGQRARVRLVVKH